MVVAKQSISLIFTMLYYYYYYYYYHVTTFLTLRLFHNLDVKNVERKT